MWHRTIEGLSLAPVHVVEQQTKPERSHPRMTTLGEDAFFLFHLFLFLWMSELVSSLGWLWLTSVMHMLFSLPLSSHPTGGWMGYMPEAYWELERAWKCPFWLYFNIFARSWCWVEPGNYSHRKTIKKILWTVLIWFFNVNLSDLFEQCLFQRPWNTIFFLNWVMKMFHLPFL